MTPAFVWRDGVHIAGTHLWCDARRARTLSFVSHAGQPLPGPHRQLLCTERTLRLLSLGEKDAPKDALQSPYSRPFSLGGLRLELFPSGYLPGAASLLLSLPGERKVAYVGDLNPQPGPLSEPLGTSAPPRQSRAGPRSPPWTSGCPPGRRRSPRSSFTWTRPGRTGSDSSAGGEVPVKCQP